MQGNVKVIDELRMSMSMSRSRLEGCDALQDWAWLLNSYTVVSRTRVPKWRWQHVRGALVIRCLVYLYRSQMELSYICLTPSAEASLPTRYSLST